MQRLLICVTLASAACSGPTHEINARGFSTAIQNHALSRTTAENRAIAELQGMLAPDGVAFTLKRAGSASLLELEQPATKATYSRVEFQPLDDGWMAIAYAERKPEVAEALAKLPAAEASATVSGPTLEMAANVAKARALEQLIDPKAEGDGVFKGAITLIDLEYAFATQEPTEKAEAEAEVEDSAAEEAPDDAPAEEATAEEATSAAKAEEAAADETPAEEEATAAETETEETADAPPPLHEVTVTVRGVAAAKRTGDASDDDTIAVQRKIAIEHFRLREWRESADVTSALLELTPQSLPFVLLKASAQFHLGESEPATETLSLAIMEAGGPEAEPLTNAYTELGKTVGADNIALLTAALEEQKVAAAEAAKKSKKKKRRKRKK